MSTPKTIIKFYDIYDLLPNYEHTRYFSSGTARDTYFDNHVGLTVNPTQHIRVDELEVKISKNISDIHSYTYMSIQNGKGANDYDHRYYCFITDMEYVSDLCTLVKYQVDVIQTFCMDGLFTSTMPYKSYVERCHNLTDQVGDNIIVEPFEPKNYNVQETTYDGMLTNMALIIGVSTADENVEIGGQVITMTPKEYYNGVVTCIRYFAFPVANIDQNQDFKDFLEAFSGDKRKEIVDAYTCPQYCLPNYSSSWYVVGSSQVTNRQIQSTIWYDGRIGSPNRHGLSGYTPKNKKMFTYPYNYLEVSNGEGDVKKLMFEYFDDPIQQPLFLLEGSFIGEPSLNLYPMKYKRKTTDAIDVNGGTVSLNINYDDIISLKNYPQCAFNVDSYAQYQSNHAVSNAVKSLGSCVASMLVGFMVGGGAGMISGAASSMAHASIGATAGMAVGGLSSTIRSSSDIIANQIQAYQSADTTIGNTGGANNAISHGHKNFVFNRKAIDAQTAEMIDNYFTMYGYAQNKIMNIGSYLQSNTRPYYAYVKTNGFSVLNGGFEQKYKIQIQNIMDKGITFWFTTGVAMGNYNLDNTPSSS